MVLGIQRSIMGVWQTVRARPNRFSYFLLALRPAARSAALSFSQRVPRSADCIFEQVFAILLQDNPARKHVPIDAIVAHTTVPVASCR
jgi:hypothetical protein